MMMRCGSKVSYEEIDGKAMVGEHVDMFRQICERTPVAKVDSAYRSRGSSKSVFITRFVPKGTLIDAIAGIGSLGGRSTSKSTTPNSEATIFRRATKIMRQIAG